MYMYNGSVKRKGLVTEICNGVVTVAETIGVGVKILLAARTKHENDRLCFLIR